MNILRVLKKRNTPGWQTPTWTWKDRLLRVVQKKLSRALPQQKPLALLTQVVLLYSVTYKLSHNLEWKDKHGNVGTSAWLFL